MKHISYDSSISSDKLYILLSWLDEFFPKDHLAKIVKLEIKWHSPLNDIAVPDLLIEFNDKGKLTVDGGIDLSKMNKEDLFFTMSSFNTTNPKE